MLVPFKDQLLMAGFTISVKVNGRLISIFTSILTRGEIDIKIENNCVQQKKQLYNCCKNCESDSRMLLILAESKSMHQLDQETRSCLDVINDLQQLQATFSAECSH